MEGPGPDASPPTALPCRGLKPTCDQPVIALETDRREGVTAKRAWQTCCGETQTWGTCVMKQVLSQGPPWLSLAGREGWQKWGRGKGGLES